MAERKIVDEEVAAIADVVKAIERLNCEQTFRVLVYVCNRTLRAMGVNYPERFMKAMEVLLG